MSGNKKDQFLYVFQFSAFFPPGITRYSEEWRKAILDEIKTQGMKSFHKVFTGNGLGKLEQDYEARRKDHITHFICRLTYSRTEELRRWFIAQELDLFRLRWTQLSSEGRQAFLKSNDFCYMSISEEETSGLLNISNGLIDKSKGKLNPKGEKLMEISWKLPYVLSRCLLLIVPLNCQFTHLFVSS